MRKLFALLFVAAAFTFAACEKKQETAGAGDSAKVDSVPASDMGVTADTAKVDTAASTAAPVDTAASTHKK